MELYRKVDDGQVNKLYHCGNDDYECTMLWRIVNQKWRTSPMWNDGGRPQKGFWDLLSKSVIVRGCSLIRCGTKRIE
jgi:hypothetical protein